MILCKGGGAKFGHKFQISGHNFDAFYERCDKSYYTPRKQSLGGI